MHPGISWAIEALDDARVAVEMVAALRNRIDVDADMLHTLDALALMICHGLDEARVTGDDD